MKNTYDLLFMLVAGISSYAQAIRSYSQFDIGTGVAMNTVTGDAKVSLLAPAFNINLGYNPDPYLNHIVELQLGSFEGGNKSPVETARYFKNNFKTISFRTQIQLGWWGLGTDNPYINSLKSIYGGFGVGIIDNDVKSVSVESLNGNGVQKSLGVFLPIRLGYKYKVKNVLQKTLFKLDFGYQYNYTFDDNIDGLESGSFKDYFSQFFVGLKIGAFGSQWAHTY